MKTNIIGSAALCEALLKEAGITFVPENVVFNDPKLIGDLRLPKDWDKALELLKSKKETPLSPSEVKVGDIVVVLPSDECYDNSEKCPQVVTKVRPENDLPFQLLFQNGGTNVYSEVRKATPEEAASFVKEEIQGYYPEQRCSTIGYGCNQFTAEELRSILIAFSCIRRMDNGPILTSKGVEYPNEEIVNPISIAALLAQLETK